MPSGTATTNPEAGARPARVDAFVADETSAPDAAPRADAFATEAPSYGLQCATNPPANPGVGYSAAPSAAGTAAVGIVVPGSAHAPVGIVHGSVQADSRTVGIAVHG